MKTYHQFWDNFNVELYIRIVEQRKQTEFQKLDDKYLYLKLMNKRFARVKYKRKNKVF
jgi:hypothetical protein